MSKATVIRKAVYLRQNIQATGVLYRLDPPYQQGGQTVKVVLVQCSKSQPVIPGFISWPAYSEIYEMEERTPDRFWRVKSIVNLQGQFLSHKTVLMKIGYSLA